MVSEFDDLVRKYCSEIIYQSYHDILEKFIKKELNPKQFRSQLNELFKNSREIVSRIPLLYSEDGDLSLVSTRP
jgi:hypothetical protein